MRVPIESYVQGRATRVFSFVVGVPFSPLDIDLSHLARGEWNVQVDRFRIWYLPGERGEDAPVCYVMVRKFDPRDGALVFGHMVVNLGGRGREKEDGWNFTVGILSNDEVRARAMLSSMLEIPPSYHRRSEVKVIEKRWRNDSGTMTRFLANVHSAAANLAPNPSGKVYTVKFEPPPDVLGEFRQGMGAWWQK
jgi:hypothetical protein